MPLISTSNPRAGLELYFDYVRRMRRYTWVVLLFLLLGAAGAAVTVLARAPRYESSASLFHQERIQTAILQGPQMAAVQRNMGERFRESLLARSSLVSVIEDPKLNPYPDLLKQRGKGAAVEALRREIKFDALSSNTFRILYADEEPRRAQQVTIRLTELLLAKDAESRKDQAQATVDFAEKEKAKEETTLHGLRETLHQFVVDHPEFADENRNDEPVVETGGGDDDVQLSILQRQASRIRKLLSKSDKGSRHGATSGPSAAQRADAARERRDAAQRALDALSGKYYENHPSVRQARDALATAQADLAKAEREARATGDDTPPLSPSERAARQEELAQIEDQIAGLRAGRRHNRAPAPAPILGATKRVAELETKYDELRHDVEEQVERVKALGESYFRAQILASQQLAEPDSLSVVDPAFEPVEPLGKSRTLLAASVVALGGFLGLLFALGLAVIDDRLYRRTDFSRFQLTPLLVVIPKARRRWFGRRRRTRRPLPRPRQTSTAMAAGSPDVVIEPPAPAPGAGLPPPHAAHGHASHAQAPRAH